MICVFETYVNLQKNVVCDIKLVSYTTFLCRKKEDIHEKFKKIYMQQNFEQRISDESKELRIRISERNEEWVQPYITNLVYVLKVPKLLYAVCTDQNGKKFLLIDKCKRKGNIEIVPFDNNTILLTDLNSKNVDYSVEIEIKDNP